MQGEGLSYGIAKGATLAFEPSKALSHKALNLARLTAPGPLLPLIGAFSIIKVLPFPLSQAVPRILSENHVFQQQFFSRFQCVASFLV